jgi:hypothetical protein
MIPPVSHSIDPERLVSLKAKSADGITARSLAKDLRGEILRRVPSTLRDHPLIVAVANAAAEPRTIEELQAAKAELEGKLRNSSNYTDRQLWSLNKQKKRLDCTIRDKQLYNGFAKGFVDIVPGIPIKCASGRWIWSHHLTFRSQLRNKKRYIKTNWRRGMRAMGAQGAHGVNLNFDLNTDVVHARSEDEKA